MAVSALDLYLSGRRYTDTIKTIASAPVSERAHLSILILASTALELYFRASLAKAGQPPVYPSYVPFYAQDFTKLYQQAQSAGLTKVEGVDQLIEKANSFHQFFKIIPGTPGESAGAGYVLLLSYLDDLGPRPPSPDILERLDKAVEAHVRAGTG